MAEAAPASVSASGAAASGVAAADSFKDEGNKSFASGRYANAINSYTLAIEALEGATEEERKARLPALLSNRAFANLKAENYGSAIADAGECLTTDPTFIKAYYRRGSANLALARYKVARGDFRAVLRLKPGDPDATAKLDVCEKAIRKAAFEAAIATEATKSLFERLDVDAIPIDASYAGPVLPAIPEPGSAATPAQCAADPSAVNEHGISLSFVRAMIEHFRSQKSIHRKVAGQLLARLKRMLDKLPSLVHMPIPEGAERFNVCGDTHGQYYDTLHIFELAGEPSPTNPYLFNGDFVDRGSFSCENVFTLMAWQLLYPQTFWLTRGNHETVAFSAHALQNMNKMYGFEGEVVHKYDRNTMDMFTEVFRALPLAVVIDRKVLVLHGGLFEQDGVKLEALARIDRFREPGDNDLMSQALWSDPSPVPGRGPSKRGVGSTFGPDVSARFLDDNGLELLIRSHEVQDEGATVMHNGRVITVFSAPNYCDSMGNKGAVVQLNRECKPSFLRFESVPHPNVKPMAYASGMMSMYGL